MDTYILAHLFAKTVHSGAACKEQGQEKKTEVVTNFVVCVPVTKKGSGCLPVNKECQISVSSLRAIYLNIAYRREATAANLRQAKDR